MNLIEEIKKRINQPMPPKEEMNRVMMDTAMGFAGTATPMNVSDDIAAKIIKLRTLDEAGKLLPHHVNEIDNISNLVTKIPKAIKSKMGVNQKLSELSGLTTPIQDLLLGRGHIKFRK